MGVGKYINNNQYFNNKYNIFQCIIIIYVQKINRLTETGFPKHYAHFRQVAVKKEKVKQRREQKNKKKALVTDVAKCYKIRDMCAIKGFRSVKNTS